MHFLCIFFVVLSSTLSSLFHSFFNFDCLGFDVQVVRVPGALDCHLFFCFFNYSILFVVFWL